MVVVAAAVVTIVRVGVGAKAIEVAAVEVKEEAVSNDDAMVGVSLDSGPGRLVLGALEEGEGESLVRENARLVASIAQAALLQRHRAGLPASRTA